MLTLLTCVTLSLSRKFYPGQHLQFVVKRIRDSPNVQSQSLERVRMLSYMAKGSLHIWFQVQNLRCGSSGLSRWARPNHTAPESGDPVLRHQRDKTEEERSQLCVRETRHAVAGFEDGGTGLRAKGSSGL